MLSHQVDDILNTFTTLIYTFYIILNRLHTFSL